MHILFYAKSGHGLQSVMKRLIADIVSEEQFEVYQEVGAFKSRLLRPKATAFITVIAPLDFDDLGEILTLDSLLHDRKVVLILPDRREETIRRGHLLWPRFLTFADGQLNWVIEVVKKMMEPKPFAGSAITFDKAAHRGDGGQGFMETKEAKNEDEGQTKPIP